MAWEEIIAGSDAEWLEGEGDRLGGEREASRLRACYDELALVEGDEQEELSEECDEILNPDTGPVTFLEEWWWVLGIGAVILIFREE